MTPPANHLSEDELKRRLYSWALNRSTSPLFKGSSGDLGQWFLLVEQACRQCKIPDTQRTEAGILLIFETGHRPLQTTMGERHAPYLEKSGQGYWPWKDFKEDIAKVVTASETPCWNRKKAAGIALIVGSCAVFAVSGGIIAFNLVGFGVGGVAKGSLAALIQSVFYGGSTAGIFSFFQMLGATATFPAVEGLIVAFIANMAGRHLGR